MSSWKTRLALKVAGRKVTVPLASCVHFGAFRYGRNEPHPYETYARKLVRDGDRRAARAWLVEFLQYYRPRHLGEAIGATLDGRHGLWHFPWRKVQPADDGWFDDPVGYPDIITQFCPEGVLWFRIEQEFFWLERSIYAIRRHGYQPERGDPVMGWKFVQADGAEAYLVLDGNHRISALAALGVETVELNYFPKDTIHERDVARWAQVRAGRFSEEEARRVLRAYFTGHANWRTTETPAPLLECPP